MEQISKFMNRIRVLDGFTLKCIAMLSMLIDHIGAVLFPQYRILRIIGRLAFPIYCFLLVEGAVHTSNRKKYAIRLLVFALLSEVPFDLAFFHTVLDTQHQNVFFTLFLGLMAICFIERFPRVWPLGLVFAAIAQLLMTDYGAIGVVYIMLYFVLKERYYYKHVSFAIVNGVAYYGQIQMYAGLSGVLLMLYNGQKGGKMKYFFYVFYPLHLLILYLISKTIY